MDRVDDVGEQDRADDSEATAGLGAEAGAAGPVDHHHRLIALDPRDMPGADVEHATRLDDGLRARIQSHAEPAGEDDPTVVELTRCRARAGLRMLQPAPARLKHDAADDRPGQPHLLSLPERVGLHSLGPIEVLDLDPAGTPLVHRYVPRNQHQQVKRFFVRLRRSACPAPSSTRLRERGEDEVEA
jgi:hypothetical protein